MRVMSRRISRASLWWDDYLIILAMVRGLELGSNIRLTQLQIAALGESISMLVGMLNPCASRIIDLVLIKMGIIGSNVGLGRHLVTLSGHQIVAYLKVKPDVSKFG